MTYRERLYSDWKVAKGRIRAGTKRGWPEVTMAELRVKEREAYNALHAEELRLMQPDSKLVY